MSHQRVIKYLSFHTIRTVACTQSVTGGHILAFINAKKNGPNGRQEPQKKSKNDSGSENTEKKQSTKSAQFKYSGYTAYHELASIELLYANAA